MPTHEDNLAGIFLSEEGWWFPGGCTNGRHAKYLAKIEDSLPVVKRMRQRRTVVQAGANVGGWPVTLARRFERVVTAEIDDANWLCLQRNLDARPKSKARIEAHRAALGERAGQGHTVFNRGNPAGHKFQFAGESFDVPGKYEVLADPVEVITIDGLELDGVDAIFLDIEGAELPALKGAARTIARDRPEILVEIREHGELHGYGRDDIEKWLRQFGYRHVKMRVGKDQWFSPR